MQPGFETIEACQAEDRNRARALRALGPKQRAGTRRKSVRKHHADAPSGDAIELATALETIADPAISKPARSCLASAVHVPQADWLAGAHCDLDAALGFVETRFRDYCGRHQCRASDIADRSILTFLDTLGALRQLH